MEADLAFRGVDLRDLWRPGGLSLRRLWVLIQALPPESLTWRTIEAEYQKTLTGVERQRERAAYYAKGGT